MLHPNSTDAHAQGKESGHFNERERLILEKLKEAGPMTDREVMTALSFSEPNAVRPRITEMVRRGDLVEVGSKVCPVTHKTVRIVSTLLVYQNA